MTSRTPDTARARTSTARATRERMYHQTTSLEAILAALIATAAQAGARTVRITSGIAIVMIEDDGAGWQDPQSMIRTIAGHHATSGSMCRRMNIARMLWDREAILTSRPKDSDGFSVVLNDEDTTAGQPTVRPAEQSRTGSAVVINLAEHGERLRVADNARWAALGAVVPVVLDGTPV